MTKSIRQVKQDLVNLKSTVAETATELEALYHNYLKLLSQSLKQQLILACYQVCTQVYPQSFLNLSLSEKQDLQQGLREIGAQLEPELTGIIEQKKLEPEPVEFNLMAKLIESLPKQKKTETNTRSGIKSNSESDRSSAPEIDLELIKKELQDKLGAEIGNIEFIELDAIAAESESESESDYAASDSTPLEADNAVDFAESASDESEIVSDLEAEADTNEPELKDIDFDNPEHLILWYRQIERGIKKTLDKTSRLTNKHLQQGNILPNGIPNKVIDIAMRADSVKGVKDRPKQPSIPQVIHLAIEPSKDQTKTGKSTNKALQVSLVRLRLAELEFADRQLNASRREIRNLVSKIKTLENQYQTIVKEEEIVEAQAAWRSSWYED